MRREAAPFPFHDVSTLCIPAPPPKTQPQTHPPIIQYQKKQGIAAFYPCTYCRKDFQDCIKADPPKVESRQAFSVWVCEQHNLVNAKLGKPVFDCDLGKLDKRWRTGTPRCFGEKEEEVGGGKTKDKIFIIEPGAGKKKPTP